MTICLRPHQPSAPVGIEEARIVCAALIQKGIEFSVFHGIITPIVFI